MEVRYVVLVTDDPDAISGLLQQQKLREGWNAVVRDGKGKTFAAHAPGLSLEETDVQLPASQPNGNVSELTVKGEPSIVASHRSDLTGWTTSIWVPERVFDAPVREMWNILVRAGGLALSLSLLLAYFFSRPFARLIQQMQDSLQRLGEGTEIPPIHSVLREGRDIDASLRKTADALQESQEQLRLVQRELTHRAKNLLTIIMAIATQTARRNTSLDEFLQAFSRRIQGLGASHDLLVKSDWSGVPLRHLLEAQLAPFGCVDNKRLTLAGPDITLKPDVLQALGLAIHELATNATKYGALSAKKGSVVITWEHVEEGDDARFRLSWIEKNGPRVTVPAHRGFGHVIMVNSLAATVSGDVNLVFKEKGVEWTVDAPVAAVTPTGE